MPRVTEFLDIFILAWFSISEPVGTGRALVPGVDVAAGAVVADGSSVVLAGGSLGFTGSSLPAGVLEAPGTEVVPGDALAIAPGVADVSGVSAGGTGVAEGVTLVLSKSVVNALIHILFNPLVDASCHLLLR